MPLLHIETLSSILGVLTSLIAPAVLISACGTLITSTAHRMALTSERARVLANQLTRLTRRGAALTRRERIEHQLHWVMRRVVLQQRALLLFYAATVFLVACSFALGLEALVGVIPNWLPVALGLLGVLLLLIACAVLLMEARLLIAAMRDEMSFLRAEAKPVGPPLLGRPALPDAPLGDA